MGKRERKHPIPASELSRHNKQRHDLVTANSGVQESGKSTSGIMEQAKRPLTRDLVDNVKVLKKLLGNSDDVIFRDFILGSANQIPATAVYIDGLVNKEMVQRDTLAPLMLWAQEVLAPAVSTPDAIKELVSTRLLSMLEIKEKELYTEVAEEVLNGETVLLFDGLDIAIAMGTKSWEHRGVSEPKTENLIRGPREGFNEIMKTGVALIRRRIKDPMLRVKLIRMGQRSATDVALIYVEGVANPVLVKEVRRRLDLIKTDAIIDSGYIEQYIQDSPFSPFPQIQYTERPDRVASGVLEGRVAVISDGSPNALIVPATISTFLPAPEDYYERSLLMSFIRLVRTASILFSLLLPALYVSVVSFHQEIIPTTLALTIAGSRAGVPFSALVEALVMEFTFELLREAGVRLPAPLGSTIGIVGGIIVGQAAVSAGLVSPIMVIVVALTAIGSFAVPSFNIATSFRLLRFPLLFLGGAFGLFGVTAGLVLILVHMVSLKSFGVPYLSPLAPLTLSDLTDTVVRAPVWSHRLRPLMFRPTDARRSIPDPSYYQNKRELHKDGYEMVPISANAGRHEEGKDGNPEDK